MKIIVLGCGPAGLMAAQGALDAHTANYDGDMQISILSVKRPSPLYGAQYLHQPIPRVTPGGGIVIGYQLRGDAFGYRQKVYGPLWDGSVSPEDLSEQHMGWDIRETYKTLWRLWEHAITDVNLIPANMASVLGKEPDVVINSIPRPALCVNGHNFGATEVWAAGDAPALGIRLPYQCPENMVVCNGEDNPSWYRMSNVFGHTTVEWPSSIAQVPVTTAARVQKPTKHNCDCWAETVPMIHVGRYGAWEKGVLSHTAYFNAYKKIDEMLGGQSAAAEEASGT